MFGKVEEAIEFYDKSIELDSENDGYFYDRGEFYESEGNYEMALKDYKKARELNPENSRLLFSNGLLLQCY